MIPKEKAEQLVNKFHADDGIESALICCDEIIESVMTGYLLNDSAVADYQIRMRTYYQEVRKEIEKLK